MSLALIVSSLAAGNASMSSMFVEAKDLWTRMVKDVNFDNPLSVQSLSVDLIGTMQGQFEDFAKGDDFLGHTLMGLTCYLPFYDDVDGILPEDQHKAAGVFKAIQSTSAISIHVKNMAEEAAKIFHVDLEA